MARKDNDKDFVSERDEFLEDDEKIEDPDEYERKVEEGEINADIYEDEGNELLEESDEISPEEAAFMMGAAKGGQDAKCRECGKIFKDDDEIIEAEFEGKIMRFCSNKCVEKFALKNS